MAGKLTVIITMAGLGTRFRKAGYACPKYMIEAKGKTLFEWALDSLIGYNGCASKYIFVVRREDRAAAFIREKCMGYDIPEIELIELDEMTDGQATTCMLAIPHCNRENAILIYNIDTYIEPYALQASDIRGDGFIPCFHAEGEHWSFVKADQTGKVTEIREKVRISDNCTLGAYYFSSAKLYEDLYKEYYSVENREEKGEKYVAPLYNLMLQKGLEVAFCLVEKEKVHVLGTPEELQIFLDQL